MQLIGASMGFLSSALLSVSLGDGEEPVAMNAVQRFVLTRTTTDAVKMNALQRFVLVRSP